MGSITLEKVSKSFGTTAVIPEIDLEIVDGEFVVFVGPSGCGKSTLLRMIAGLEDLSDGRIIIDGKDMSSEAPAKRGLSMVFQSYALYPHMSVYGNIAFPLKMDGQNKAAIDKKVKDAAHILNLTNYLDRRPDNYPAASASASQSAVQSCANPRRFSSTNRYPISTRRCAVTCGWR